MNQKVEEFPLQVRAYLKDKRMTEITDNHQSGDLVYQIDEEYILKISNDIERLRREHLANDYLTGKVPVSQTIIFVVENEKAYYIKTRVKGNHLIQERYLSDPKELAKLLAQAMNMLHSLDIQDCPIKSPDSEGNCFIHGDFCLPNILVDEEEISGFIDTEASGIGDPWMDYAWCIWSYEYNLGTNEYTPFLLECLGIEFDQKKYDYYTKM